MWLAQLDAPQTGAYAKALEEKLAMIQEKIRVSEERAAAAEANLRERALEIEANKQASNVEVEKDAAEAARLLREEKAKRAWLARLDAPSWGGASVRAARDDTP